MNYSVTATNLSDFLSRIGLTQAGRDRVIELDRVLADELANQDPDADRCADLVLEASGLVSDANPSVFE